MKPLKFHPTLVPQILAGEKTTTWRLFDDKNLAEGDELSLINSGTKEEFAQAIIISIVEKNFKELDEKDWKGHEKFASEEEMYETYSKYYNTKVDENTKVKIIKFKIKKII